MAVAVVTRPLPDLRTRVAPIGSCDLEADPLGQLSLYIVGPDEDVHVARGGRAHSGRHHLASPGGQG
jgi:hypothetical protein